MDRINCTIGEKGIALYMPLNTRFRVRVDFTCDFLGICD